MLPGCPREASRAAGTPSVQARTDGTRRPPPRSRRRTPPHSARSRPRTPRHTPAPSPRGRPRTCTRSSRGPRPCWRTRLERGSRPRPGDTRRPCTPSHQPPPGLGFTVWGLGFGVWGVGCRVQGVGFSVSGFRFQV
ncbi:hypothetical protein T484DRAFT_2084375 [Baffinella frigidus]|nr:hypothetical protein T484DRAFT_2084375 [Cryptophyta sp. CCMP2293]